LHENIVAADVILRIEKSDDNNNKIAEIKLHVKGLDLFAKKQCESFEEAIDNAVDALKIQIKKYKEKTQA